jgi:methylated-DNA-protein-cysteine methyltransferase-like protein
MSGSERLPNRSAAFRKIWRIVARIPRGRVATYGQIARMAGFGRGARTAGWALHALPGGLRIDGQPVPWHRVVNAQGRVSPRRGRGSDLAEVRQGSLLRREGIRMTSDGTIDLGRFGWSGETTPTSLQRRARCGSRLPR